MANRRNSLLLVCTILLMVLIVGPVWARPLGLGNSSQDVSGFQGLPWGSALKDVPGIILLDSSEGIQTYAFQNTPPLWGDIKVESIKLQTVDGKFARALIRYQGSAVHDQLLQYLIDRFGPLDLYRGSMMRGLNQHYSWEKGDTIVSLTYRGLGERGFIDVGSRRLAPRLLEKITSTF